MHLYRLERQQWIPRPAAEVLEFFSNARNLEAITPSWLKFRIMTPGPIQLREGAAIEYQLAWRFIRLRWRTAIERWDPPRGFVDIQTSGPYRFWRHTHRFEPERTGTRMFDTVEYALPLGPLGRVAHATRVRRDLEGIFDYRERAIRYALGAGVNPPMRLEPECAGPRDAVPRC